MTSVVAPDIHDRFAKLAEFLKQQPFEESTEHKFLDKWLDLDLLYEAENPGKESPSLSYDADCNLRPRWPAGWFTVQQ